MSAETYVLFELAGTAYAVPSPAVRRMDMVEHVTPVPNSPPFVDGIVLSRGEVIPAVNLRRRFGFERVAYDLKTRMIVVEHGDRFVGLIVDLAQEFVTIPDDAIKPAPDSLAGECARYLRGVAMLGTKIVLVLEISEVLGTAVVAAASE